MPARARQQMLLGHAAAFVATAAVVSTLTLGAAMAARGILGIGSKTSAASTAELPTAMPSDARALKPS